MYPPPNPNFRTNYFAESHPVHPMYSEGMPAMPPVQQESSRVSFGSLLFWAAVLFAMFGGAFFLGILFNRRIKNPVPDWVKGIRKSVTGEQAEEEEALPKSQEDSDADWLTHFKPDSKPLTADELWLKIGQRYGTIENAGELGLPDSTPTNQPDSSQENTEEEGQ